jgi:hypothetical protein
MLKTRSGADVWLITQPAHADLAGVMAAHWGNDEFARPGHYEASGDAERLRRELVLAVMEHDNGWWEWEADPAIAEEDGLPQGLGEVLKDPATGMQRWRLGIPRLAERHPYASLLIADHAYWLYAAQFQQPAPPEFTHHLQRQGRTYPREMQAEARRFVAEVEQMRQELERRAAEDPLHRAALQPAMRYPHARLLQTLDAFSLALCSNVISPTHGEARGLGEDPVVFDDVPRRNWGDRVSVRFTPQGSGRIAVDPYPFGEAPLTVSVAARVVKPHVWWRQAPATTKQFTLVR